jgi:sugar lactone lactonase YvrE
MNNRTTIAALLVLAVLVAGCGGNLAPQGQSLPLAPSASQPAHVATGPFLYVGGQMLSQYKLGSSKPLHSVQGTDGEAFGLLTLDSAGYLITRETISLIPIFDANTLQKLYTAYGDYTESLAVNRSNDIYGANCGDGISVYSPVGKGKGFVRRQNGVCTIAFDRAGKLYAAEGYNQIAIYAVEQRPAHVRLLRSIYSGITGPDALAFSRSGDLFVSNYPVYSGNGTVTVYGPNGSSPKRTLTDELNLPMAIAVDSKGTLYVANDPETYRRGHDGWVTVFAPGSDKAVRKIIDGINAPVSLATDSADNLYVANGYASTVTVYNSGGTLIRTIKEGVKNPDSLVIGD